MTESRMKEALIHLIEESGKGAEKAGYLKYHEQETEEDKTLYKLAKLMLVVSEAGEAAEAVRKPREDDHCEHLMNEEVELADIIIRVFNLAYELYGPNYFVAALFEKMKVNRERSLRKEGKRI